MTLRSPVFRNLPDPRERLERRAARGDEVARARLDPLRRDELLRASGEAGVHYGRVLYGLVPPAELARGALVSWPEPKAHCEVHFLDGEKRIVYQHAKGGKRELRPCYSLNLPDSFSHGAVLPGPDGGYSIGILLSVRLSVELMGRDWSDNRAMTTGAVVLGVDGSWYMGMGPPLHLERRLAVGWTEHSFVRTAAKLYDVALERAVVLGPMGEVAKRADALVDEIAGEFPDSVVADDPDYEGYEERQRRRRAVIDMINNPPNFLPWLYAYPFDDRFHWRERHWPDESFEPWTKDELDGWNEFLDGIEADKVRIAAEIRR